MCGATLMVVAWRFSLVAPTLPTEATDAGTAPPDPPHTARPPPRRRPAGIRTEPRMVHPQRDASTTPTAAIMLSPTIAIPKTLLEVLSAGEQSLSK